MSTSPCLYCRQFHTGTCSAMVASVVRNKDGSITITPPIISVRPWIVGEGR